MLELGIGLAILVGIGGLVIPFFRSVDRKRTEARLNFLTTRLAGNTRQLKQTTASKFPTDYLRLQQQIATDLSDLSKLLTAKQAKLALPTSQSAWDLIEEARSLLPTKGQLERPKILLPKAATKDLTDEQLKTLVPEVWSSIESIRHDDQAIRQKLASPTIPNKQELLAIHEANMNRYVEVLEAYLKMKASPKDYYQVEERLAKSKQAFQTFDLQLDETLRQINEGDMMGFEVSLRMITQNTME
ncbi:hypothetical protein [Streptococcus ovuberis]|uniref:Membrane associated protein n=1 Tax=Streptococcus ovuberis TaxID=1936207 RepID=A0A7X6MVU7_9STRE|nr:hypothetical protein [Streptococcus ovuberis]NKZ19347.1 hypothetical protein [Streptococcus ovuberis]